jgi:hypothetical protein
VNNIPDNLRLKVSKAVVFKIHKLSLKLALCLAGIAVVIAILITMRPLPGSRNAVTVSPRPMADKSGGKAVAQAEITAQTAVAVGPSTGIANPGNLQATQTGSAETASGNASSPPSTPVIPLVDPDTPLYPIDPIPCKNMYIRSGCGCEAYLAPDGAIGSCYPRCPGGGIEMMCAYPL